MGYLVSNDPLVSVGAAAVGGGGEYTTFTTSTNLDLSGETGNCRVFADTSGGVLSVTLPSGAANQVIEVIDAGENAGSNIITIVGTIDGATNATIEANGGSRSITYSGSAWESSGGFNQFFERDAATSTIKAKNPDTLQAAILAAGDSGTAYSATPSSFTDPEVNVDQGAGSWGNATDFTNRNSEATGGDANATELIDGDSVTVSPGVVDLVVSYNLSTARAISQVGVYRHSGNAYGNQSYLKRVEASSNSGATWSDIVPLADASLTDQIPADGDWVTGSYHPYNFTNSTAYADYRFTFDAIGATSNTNIQRIEMSEEVILTTLNTFVHRATSVGANIDMATLSLTDDGDNAIVDGEVLVEYSTNGGSTWNGSQLGLDAAKALGVITSAGAFWLRYEMVGANRMKSSVVQSTATYTRATSTGVETFANSVKVAEFSSSKALIGSQGQPFQAATSGFTDPEANVDQGAGSWGNNRQGVPFTDYAGNITVGGTWGSRTGDEPFGDGSAATSYTNATATFTFPTSRAIEYFSISGGDRGATVTAVRTSDSAVISLGSVAANETVFTDDATAYDSITFTMTGLSGWYNVGAINTGTVTYLSTLNTFTHRCFTDGPSTNIDLNTLTLKDDGDLNIVDGEILIEYSTNNGSTWSSQLGLDATKALGILSGITSLWFRYEMVGANKLSSSQVNSTATYSETTNDGIKTFVNSVLSHQVTGDGTLFKSFTTAERDAISTPATGLTIYNTTTNAHNVYNGTSWVELGGGGGGASAEQIANLEYNIGVNSLRDAVNGGYAYFNMVGGVGDVYTDETGVDTGAASNATYDAGGDFYSPNPASTATFLLQSNTTDGSTTFVDIAGSKSITANGDAQHDTAQAQFGTSSILLDGTGDYLIVADSDDWNFGSGAFTVECWFRPANTSGGQGLVCHGGAAPTDSSFNLYQNGATLIAAWTDGVTRTTITGGTLSANTWYHVAMVRNGDRIDLYLDGVSVANSTLTGGYVIADAAANLGIGVFGNTNHPFNGHIDEVRILKGTAAWTTNFTPPSSAYSLAATNMTLPSIDFTSNIASVDYVRPVVLWEPIDASTLNTDFILEVSRDSGTTWTAATLETDAVFTGSVVILVADEVDITGQPAGTTATYRIRTLNQKDIRVHGVYLQWR